ncbi:MAG: hypothetical protein HGB15_03780 [Chlorobaculum sp.]|jgi:hypothetical protein|nr:hypothetical protein [Chlorobaculum sp.]
MPYSKQIQNEIAALEVYLDAAYAELDALYAEFGKSLPVDVESWMKRSIQRQIEKNADKVNAEGIEPLRKIKCDLNQLIQRLPEICMVAIGTPEQWPHRKTTTPAGLLQTTPTESHASATYRRSINALGSLLAKHSLLIETQGDYSEWKQEGSDQFRYALNTGFEESRFPALVEYQEKYQEKRQDLLQKEKELKLKYQELAKARARELWNNA